MAITIIQPSVPASYNNKSVYNPIVYRATSTNWTNFDAFKYIVTIYETGTNNVVNKQVVSPDPFNNGECWVDISGVMKNLVDTDLPFPSNQQVTVPNNFYGYDIAFDESYRYTWNFNGYYFFSSLGPYNGYLGLTTNSTIVPGASNLPHGYQVGDIILVTNPQTFYDGRDHLNGYWTVVDVPDSLSVVINLVFSVVGSGPDFTGLTNYSDNRRVFTTDLVRINNKYVINTAMESVEYSTTLGDLNGYVPVVSGTTRRFLTDAPRTAPSFFNPRDIQYYVTPEQHLWLNVLDPGNAFIRLRNSNGDEFRFTPVSPNGKVTKFGVGPANMLNITPVFGTLPVIKPTTRWYQIEISTPTLPELPMTELFTIGIDRRCARNDAELLFMDRKGSYMGFGLQLNMYRKLDMEKLIHNRFTGSRETYKKGLSTVNSGYDVEYTFNTNFMPYSSHVYFEQALTSRHTYVRVGTIWRAVTIVDTSTETLIENNVTLYKRKVTVKFAFKDPVN